MTFRKTVVAALMIGLLAACNSQRSDLKSPCAGAEGSPCGPRHSVNGWWLHPADQG